MEEELTSKMHSEFAQDEEERLEFAAMAAYMEINKHKKDFDDTLKEYGLTVEQYEKHRPYQGKNPIWD